VKLEDRSGGKLITIATKYGARKTDNDSAFTLKASIQELKAILSSMKLTESLKLLAEEKPVDPIDVSTNTELSNQIRRFQELVAEIEKIEPSLKAWEKEAKTLMEGRKDDEGHLLVKGIQDQLEEMKAVLVKVDDEVFSFTKKTNKARAKYKEAFTAALKKVNEATKKVLNDVLEASKGADTYTYNLEKIDLSIPGEKKKEEGEEKAASLKKTAGFSWHDAGINSDTPNFTGFVAKFVDTGDEFTVIKVDDKGLTVNTELDPETFGTSTVHPARVYAEDFSHGKWELFTPAGKKVIFLSPGEQFRVEGSTKMVISGVVLERFKKYVISKLTVDDSKKKQIESAVLASTNTTEIDNALKSNGIERYISIAEFVNVAAKEDKVITAGLWEMLKKTWNTVLEKLGLMTEQLEQSAAELMSINEEAETESGLDNVF
jgi:hypothetical protein